MSKNSPIVDQVDPVSSTFDVDDGFTFPLPTEDQIISWFISKGKLTLKKSVPSDLEVEIFLSYFHTSFEDDETGDQTPFLVLDGLLFWHPISGDEIDCGQHYVEDSILRRAALWGDDKMYYVTPMYTTDQRTGKKILNNVFETYGQMPPDLLEMYRDHQDFRTIVKRLVENDKSKFRSFDISNKQHSEKAYNDLPDDTPSVVVEDPAIELPKPKNRSILLDSENIVVETGRTRTVSQKSSPDKEDTPTPSKQEQPTIAPEEIITKESGSEENASPEKTESTSSKKTSRNVNSDSDEDSPPKKTESTSSKKTSRQVESDDEIVPVKKTSSRNVDPNSEDDALPKKISSKPQAKSSSRTSDSEDDALPKKISSKPQAKSSSRTSDSDSESDERPKKTSSPTKPLTKSSRNVDPDSEDDVPQRKISAKPQAKPSRNVDPDSESDELPNPPKKSSAKQTSRQLDSDSDTEEKKPSPKKNASKSSEVKSAKSTSARRNLDDSDDDTPPRTTKSTSSRRNLDDSDDDTPVSKPKASSSRRNLDDSDDGTPSRPSKSTKTTSARRSLDDSDDDTPIKSTKVTSSKKTNSSSLRKNIDSDSDSDDIPQPRTQSRTVVKKSAPKKTSSASKRTIQGDSD